MKKIIFVLLAMVGIINAQPVSTVVVKHDSTKVFYTPTQALSKINYADTGSVIASQYLMRKTAHDSTVGKVSYTDNHAIIGSTGGIIPSDMSINGLLFRTNVPGNVATLQLMDSTGYSVIRAVDYDGVEKTAWGYGNPYSSGASNTFQNSAFWESSSVNTPTFPPIRIIQSAWRLSNHQNIKRAEFSSDGTIHFYSIASDSVTPNDRFDITDSNILLNQNSTINGNLMVNTIRSGSDTTNIFGLSFPPQETRISVGSAGAYKIRFGVNSTSNTFTEWGYFSGGNFVLDNNLLVSSIRSGSDTTNIFGLSFPSGATRLSVGSLGNYHITFGSNSTSNVFTQWGFLAKDSLQINPTTNSNRVTIMTGGTMSLFAGDTTQRIIIRGTSSTTNSDNMSFIERGNIILSSGATSGIETNTLFLSSGGRVLINSNTDNGVDKLQVNGSMSSGAITSSGTIKTAGYTVATLPAGTIGMTTYVTDATAPTYLGTLTGGGTVKCPVFYNGTAWVSY